MASVAFLNPLSKSLPSESWDIIRAYARRRADLNPLLEELSGLSQTLACVSGKDHRLGSLSRVSEYTTLLHEWATGFPSDSVASARSSVITLPLLVVLQVVQYFWYLRARSLKHEAFLSELRNGYGVHGFCGGLLVALTIACSESEEDVIRNARIAIRLGYVLGAFIELGDDTTSPSTSMIVVRLKYENQGTELVSEVPGVCVFLVQLCV